MNNIEAMTIGAKARLHHLLDVDVARHKAEMRLYGERYMAVNYQFFAPQGSFYTTDGQSANWLLPVFAGSGGSGGGCAGGSMNMGQQSNSFLGTTAFGAGGCS